MNHIALKEIRLMRKIKLNELSKKTRINRNTLSQIENGKRNPTIKTIENIVASINAKVIITL